MTFTASKLFEVRIMRFIALSLVEAKQKFLSWPRTCFFVKKSLYENEAQMAKILKKLQRSFSTIMCFCWQKIDVA